MRRQRFLDLHAATFLDVLAKTGSRTMAAGAVELTVAEVTSHRDADPDFERAWRDAERRARQRVKQLVARRPLGARRGDQ